MPKIEIDLVIDYQGTYTPGRPATQTDPAEAPEWDINKIDLVFNEKVAWEATAVPGRSRKTTRTHFLSLDAQAKEALIELLQAHYDEEVGDALAEEHQADD